MRISPLLGNFKIVLRLSPIGLLMTPSLAKLSAADLDQLILEKFNCQTLSSILSSASRYRSCGYKNGGERISLVVVQMAASRAAGGSLRTF